VVPNRSGENVKHNFGRAFLGAAALAEFCETIIATQDKHKATLVRYHQIVTMQSFNASRFRP
jgi:hypothetical protein